jgi:hypothetical protein
MGKFDKVYAIVNQMKTQAPVSGRPVYAKGVFQKGLHRPLKLHTVFFVAEAVAFVIFDQVFNLNSP